MAVPTLCRSQFIALLALCCGSCNGAQVFYFCLLGEASLEAGWTVRNLWVFRACCGWSMLVLVQYGTELQM